MNTLIDGTERKQIEVALRESDAFNLAILNSFAAEIAVLNHDGVIVAVNEAWRRFALEKGSVPDQPVPRSEVGFNYLEVCRTTTRVTENGALDAHDGIRAVLDGRLSCFSLEYPCHAFGQQRWYSMNVTPLGSDIRGVVVAHSNITGRKRAEQELARLNQDLQHRGAELERYRDLVEQAVDGIFVSDSQGRYLDVNSAGASMLGYTRDEILRLSIPDILVDEDVSRIAPEVAKLGGGGVIRSEWLFRRKDGSVFPGEVMGRRLPDGRLQAFLRDITERKLAERAGELAEQRLQMEESCRFLVAIQTAAAIAHELHQPLTAIASYAEVALLLLRTGSPDPQKLRHVLQNTERQVYRAGQVTRQLLALLHKGETPTEPVDIGKSLENALAILRADGKLGEFMVDLDIAPGLPPVQANRLQIEKVLVNLLHNGLESMLDLGLRAGTVKVAARAAADDDSKVHVMVRDCGKGLDAQSHRSIFQPFYTTKPKGLGMGLAVSRALIEAHGGKLWAEPNAGPGASFHFTLPIAR